jgi:septum site-determining protein MinC
MSLDSLIVTIKTTKSLPVAYETLATGTREEYEALLKRYRASAVHLVLDLTRLTHLDFAFIARLVDAAVLQQVKLLGLVSQDPDVAEFVEHIAVAVFAPDDLTQLGEIPLATAPSPVAKGGVTASAVLPYTRVLVNPLRSGMQIEHEGDVVVLAHVSSGAEIRATGHVHIYAKVEGRVFAGAKGYDKAKIFTRSMEAEMFSIAGVFVLYDQLEPFRHQPNSFILGVHEGQMRIHPL